MPISQALQVGWLDERPEGSLRTRVERMGLILQVFARCRRLKLPAPTLSDLDAFLDGRTSIMPPAGPT